MADSGFWDSFNKSQDIIFDDSSFDDTPIVSQVLSSLGIPQSMVGGSSLKGIDLEHINSKTAVALSLAAVIDTSGMLELTTNEFGSAETYDVPGSSMPTSNLYYTLVGESYDYSSTSVAVTGMKPRPLRSMGAPKDVLVDKQIWDTSKTMQNCFARSFQEFSTITFDDPHLDGAWSDGVQHTFKFDDPFTRYIGWIWDINPGSLTTTSTAISQDTNCSVPILLAGTENYSDIAPESCLADLGTLLRHPTDKSEGEQCVSADSTNPLGIAKCGYSTVTLELPKSLRYEDYRGTKQDNFRSLSKIYMFGYVLDSVWSCPKDDVVATQDPDPKNMLTFIELNNLMPQIIPLELGVDYAIAYDFESVDNDGFLKICVQFANNAELGDDANYGTKIPYKVSPDCKLYIEGTTDGEGTIFPRTGGSGVLVFSVFAVVQLNKPCFNIHDTRGNAANIAQELTASIAAIKLYDPPAPRAIDGTLVDLSTSWIDNDPTTVQDIQNSDYEKFLTTFDKVPMVELTMANMEEGAIMTLSNSIKGWINQSKGISNTYVFGPEATGVQLGQRTSSNGVVSSITYNYSDSGTYTVSVIDGPIFQDFGGVTMMPNYQEVDNVQLSGYISEDMGNNVEYKVMLEGYGPMLAYNGTAAILRVGDRVSVKVNNLPREGKSNGR